MVDHGTAPAAAPAGAPAVAVGAAREHGHGDVEDGAARAARHEQLPPGAAFDLKTFERMTGMNVERPDGVATSLPRPMPRIIRTKPPGGARRWLLAVSDDDHRLIRQAPGSGPRRARRR